MQTETPKQYSKQLGQSLVEYTLIVALVIFSMAAAIAATGPAIGNVFSNTVYNLLGTDPENIDDLPDKDAFWLTVTWISQQTPVEEALPTRTGVPPTEQPTDGPSPTPTDTLTPTPTVPTSTPTPSPTPQDEIFEAPWHDSADVLENWRVGGDVFLGAGLGWYAEFFPNTTLGSTATSGQYTSEIDPDKQYDLDFDWGNAAPIENWPAGDPNNNFSVSFRRHIYLEDDLELRFKITEIDDGYRVWIVPGHLDLPTARPGNCSSTGITWGGTPNKNSVTVYDNTDDCLVIDAWGGNYNKKSTAKRTVAAGAYTVFVDMVEFSGGADVQFSIDSPTLSGNPDDTPVDSSGNPESGAADCRWGNVEDSRDSNSERYRWDSWQDGSDFAVGYRCYLELRGSVLIPAGMIDPVLTFWDVWDMRDPSMKAWIEVAEYDSDDDGIFDRFDDNASLDWQVLNIHTGDSTNYNWTYQRIDLRTLMGLSGADTMEDKHYIIRFGMEVPEASYSTGNDRGYRLWWVDSINIDEEPQSEFYPAKSWDFNTFDQGEDFITSGRWKLSKAKSREGGQDYAWDDSEYANYEKTNLDGCGSSSSSCSDDYSDQNLRMHTLEFNGIVDLDHPLGAVDEQGDGGDAILSFWQSYDIRKYTGLEIQYTTDLDYDSGEAPVWKVVPTGQINSRDNTSQPYENSFIFTEVNLEELKALEPAANGKFRIRFAMTVSRNSDTDQGWWIDDIKLERLSISSFLIYPYQEGFEQEETINDWLLGGSWGRSAYRAYRPDTDTAFSLTDSPALRDTNGDLQQETYITNRESSAEMRIAFDVNNDSPLNPYSPACVLVPSNLCDEPDNDTPDDPVLTFQWWHDFGSSGGENFYLEWKKADDSDGVWKELWTYNDRMSYNSRTDDSTRRQWNWQRVEVDLNQIWVSTGFDNNLPDSTTDDDILLRFRFKTNGNNNNADGVYIDDIEIKEREERVHALWSTGVSEDVENTAPPTNEPLVYTTGDFQYIKFIADSAILGHDYATIAEFNLLDKDANLIPRSAWTIESYSSDRSPNYLIGNMLDDDTNTAWFSYTDNPRATYPHEFVINLGADYQVGYVQILPRQIDPSNSWYKNGWIEDYRVYLSEDNSDFDLVKDGSLADTPVEQTIALQIDYTTDTAPADSGDTVTVVGDGATYRDNLDDRADDIFDNWYLGGTWAVIDWAQRDGVLSFHDSTSAPLNSGETEETLPPDFSRITNNSGRTFNVLEMATIIDLRATDAASKPIMTFWQRHHIGSSSRIRVQISVEDPDTIGDPSYCWDSALDQCYDHLYGWTEWETAPPWNQGGAYNDWDKSGEVKQFLWKREIVDLSPFAADGSDSGKRIRVRFVSDSMDRGENDGNLKDGWYIDDIEFKSNIQTTIKIDADTGAAFFDAARNTRNWVMEGTWGLSPEFFRGSGGGPADFGGKFWTYWIYDMTSCPNDSNGFRNCVRNYFDGNRSSPYNNWDNVPYEGSDLMKRKGVVLDINNDWGSGGPAGLTYDYAGIWELTTPVIGTTMNPGTYTFVFTYDEAVRAKYDTVPAGQLPSGPGLPDLYNPEWNIFNDFNTGGRQVNVGTATFESGKQYKIRLEFFDYRNDGAFIVSLGSSSFSFTDSPKQGAGIAFDEIPAAPRSNSSMIFNGVFDLSDAVDPQLQYYTFYELEGSARIEVTTDGGFTWSTNGLRGSTPAGFWTSDWSADFWDDTQHPRFDTNPNNSERMAYVRPQDSPFGLEEFDKTAVPPDHSFSNWANDDFNLNWGSNLSPVNGWVKDDWSAQFRRSFHLDNDMEITFRLESDDGHRMWLNLNGTGYFPGCASVNGQPVTSGKPKTSSGEDVIVEGSSTSCLLISDWEEGGQTKEVTRRIPAGDHEIIVDYYENSGGSRVRFRMWAGEFDWPTYNGVWMPDEHDWLQRVHSLSYYAGRELDGDPKPPVGLRFHLDRSGVSENGTGWQEQDSSQNPFSWKESWWVTDIAIIDTTSG